MAKREEIVIAGTQTHLGKDAALKILFTLVVLGLLVAGVSIFLSLFIDFRDWAIFKAALDNPVQTVILYLFITVIATVIVPLPILPVVVLLVNIFNPWLIMGVQLVGDLIGTAIAYFLARRFGRRLIRRWFSQKNASEIIAISDSVSWRHYFWIAMFPLVNTELVAYAAGLGRLKLWTVLWIIAVAVGYRLLIVILFAL